MDFLTASNENQTGPAFCPHCGTILDLSVTDNLACSACKYACQYKDLACLTKVTVSQDQPLPKWMVDKKSRLMNVQEGPARATVEETCPKCGNPEMEFYTMQLRSADEGQTVFYECRTCGHKFSVNT